MDAGGSLGPEPINQNALSIAPTKPDRNRKRLKLDYKPPPSTDIAQLRQQICDHKRKCQEQLKEAYRDNLTELFFLQHGFNIMDLVSWRKKPNVELKRYLKIYSIDEEDESVDAESLDNPVKPETLATPAIQQLPFESKSDTKRNATGQSTDSQLQTPSQETPVNVENPSDAMFEQAKKEAQVMQRVTALRKQGLWSARRMPKVQEPSRAKAHWDYLLEEMQWLAADFAQERKWKKAGCRKISRMVMRYHQERMDDEKKAEKEESGRLRRIAGQLAKQIKDFWSNIEKVVQYKYDSRLDEKRRQALDLHLNFIVGQTEKYSSWLSAGLAGTPADTSKVASSTASPQSHVAQEDVEFQPQSASSDDEETIAKEEEQSATDQNDTDAEIAALQAESEMPLDELLSTLPSEVLEQPASVESSSSEDSYHSTNENMEFEGESNEAADDEETLNEQEQHEEQDYDDELKDLKDEGEMTVEELAAKYAGAYASDFELPDTPSSTDVDSESGEDEDQESSSEEEEPEGGDENEAEQSEDIGMEYLLHPEKDEEEILSDREANEGPGREITDIAAAAQSLQPTGYTLETTKVQTPIPFLLKHNLREYQHVGLDWLATMYEKKLNGILADEMGLGKTIQTIALLAHLACEHGIWGPHLIVVPTSVMLNWEMELKKWCPGFKILTYYGSQKERKMKRVGWTKTNAFHVCITSYKLVIQDHAAFKRKKWKYLILDEAQNIKNFKSQRWQTLLNFSSQRRLLLTGTPLQNNLMELWSLMHFLMPNVFQSHMEFKEWFANPLTGMIEGTSEYNDQLIRRLHKVLRPFLLRRLKADVERQLPKKYEHVVMCKLSKRQRFLYEEFMSRRATKDTLASGNFMSVINILMQLRKVCNHPDMFDPRPIISPFETEPLSIEMPSDVIKALQYEPLKTIDIRLLSPCLAGLEQVLSVYAAHRSRELQTPRKLIEMIDDASDPPIRPPPTKLRPFVIRSPTASQPKNTVAAQTIKTTNRVLSGTAAVMKSTSTAAGTAKPVIKQEPTSTNITLSGPLTSLVSPSMATTKAMITGKPVTTVATTQPITLQIQQTPQGTRLMIPSSQLSQLQAGYVHIIQTSSGQHLITSAANAQSLANASATATSGASRIVPIGSVSISGAASKLGSTQGSSTEQVASRPLLRVTPVTSSSSTSSLASSVTMPSVVSKSSSLNSVTRTASPQTTVIPLATSAVTTNGSAEAPVVKQHTSVKPAVSVVGKSAKPLIGPASRKRVLESEARQKFESELKLVDLDARRSMWRKSQLARLVVLNKKHCGYRPVYGKDLHDAVDVWSHGLNKGLSSFSCNSAAHCYNAMENPYRNRPYCYWRSTNHLKSLLLNPVQRFEQMRPILERFVFVTPTVRTSYVQLHSPCKSKLISYNELVDYVSKKELSDKTGLLHPIKTRMLVQFPEKRLIQYDCGKLQTLDVLLRDLKQNSHRVLIFTQMTRMLDVLEAFLNYHGHRYLRLDGTTKVEMRQALMDRFNADNKIFVFILSTRSGGIGVNLTGADTVIFYDSDWNPTMDAQAQDRCHRIGQTRDVHIYRLVSQKTIEENILKKANQKRLLGDVAIEGGNFTTATLQQNTITDLFAEPSGLQSLIEQKNAELPELPAASGVNQKQFEQALGQAEDDEDVKAAVNATAEAGAELAEFDENIPWDEREADMNKQQNEKTSKVEREIAMLEKELTPVERYAVQFLELTDDQFSEEAVQQAELDIEQAKRDWELNRLKQQREEEERLAELEEDDMLYTYSKEDGMNQVPKKLTKFTKKKKVVEVEPSRKSRRPPKPKHIDSESDNDVEVTKRPKKRGRPPKKKLAVTESDVTSDGKVITVNSVTADKVMLKRKPGSQTFIIGSSPVSVSRRTNGHPMSETSDVDI